MKKSDLYGFIALLFGVMCLSALFAWQIWDGSQARIATYASSGLMIIFAIASLVCKD